MAKLIWSNLKKNKCPQCNKDFTLGLLTIPHQKLGEQPDKLLSHWCGFSIREKRYREIVASQITASLEKELSDEFTQEGENPSN